MWKEHKGDNAMSRSWNTEELKAASTAMEQNGQMGFEAFCKELEKQGWKPTAYDRLVQGEVAGAHTIEIRHKVLAIEEDPQRVPIPEMAEVLPSVYNIIWLVSLLDIISVAQEPPVILPMRIMIRRKARESDLDVFFHFMQSTDIGMVHFTDEIIP